MTPKRTAKSMAAMLVLGCLATPALAGEPASEAAVPYVDNQFDVYSAADLETWWRHYAPTAVAQAQKSPEPVQQVSTPSNAAQPAPASESVADDTTTYADNQFDVYSAADLETWWRHYAPTAVAQKAPSPAPEQVGTPSLLQIAAPAKTATASAD
jgi:hypothetical protein